MVSTYLTRKAPQLYQGPIKIEQKINVLSRGYEGGELVYLTFIIKNMMSVFDLGDLITGIDNSDGEFVITRVQETFPLGDRDGLTEIGLKNKDYCPWS